MGVGELGQLGADLAHRSVEIDLHCGGQDLRFPHHENERAQAVALGKQFAFLKSPDLPASLGEAVDAVPGFARLAHVTPVHKSDAPWQENMADGPDVDLETLPICTCWPGDAAPLITWGLVITRGPDKPRVNLAIYRLQLTGKNKLIMRWLEHRGGAQDFRAFRDANPGKPYPVSVVIGADPATLLAAVTPVPDTLSEYQFAGLLRGRCFGARFGRPLGSGRGRGCNGLVLRFGRHGVGLEHDQRGAHGYHVPDLAGHGNDLPADGRSQFHRGLVGQHGADRFLFADRVTDLDHPFGDLRLDLDHSRIACRETVVYDNPAPRDSLAFRMYADGIRALVFREGLDDEELRNARVALNEAVRQVIANGLELLGVSAPREM